MPKLHTATRSIHDWRMRLGDPEKHWKKGASAMETAVSWELAAKSASGLPEPIASLFAHSEFGEGELLLGVAEHKVPLEGTGGASQCDVWALVRTAVGTVSLAVEAKAQESFGEGNETLADWLNSGTSKGSKANRTIRKCHLLECLPAGIDGAYDAIPYQILQRCAASVIEARRFGLQNAAFVVQAFLSPSKSFEMFERFCQALGIPATRDRMSFAQVGEIKLGVGWADCKLASDAETVSVI